MFNEHAAQCPMKGTHRLYRVDEATGLWLPGVLAERDNQWQYTYGYLIAKAFGQRDPSYGLNCMYIEFENVADPEDAVSIPSFTRQDDRTYYEGLASNPLRDFLRIPLRVTPLIDAAPGYEAFFPDPGTGNRLTIFAQSSGTQGTFGKAFSDGANSKVCGVALVAAPVLADRTRDVLYARSYYAVDQQQVKSPGAQFGVQYSLFWG